MPREAELIGDQRALIEPTSYRDPWITVRHAAEMIPVDRSTMLRAIQRAERDGRITTIKLPWKTGQRLVRESDVRRLYPDLRRHSRGRKPLNRAERAEVLGTETITPGTPEFDDAKRRHRHGADE